MSYEIIATIILFGSLVGMGIIVLRKIPILAELPEVIEKPQEENFISKLKEKIKVLNPFRNFSIEIFLQKILSKIRILTLKTESKVASWLQRLRERAQKKKSKENDNYWKEIKKSTKNNQNLPE